MIKTFFVLSILSTIISFISLIAGVGTFHLFLDTLIATMILGALASFQGKVEESFKIHNNIIVGLQQRCNKLEEEVKKLKTKK